MDFQLARNLSALARAQEETRKAFLHIDSLADCLNREIIMTAASYNGAACDCGQNKPLPASGYFGDTI